MRKLGIVVVQMNLNPRSEVISRVLRIKGLIMTLLILFSSDVVVLDKAYRFAWSMYSMLLDYCLGQLEPMCMD